jgi:hypothetical protein
MEAVMNPIRELVDLPDPALRPLVHPLDVPEARRPLRISWLIWALTNPAVGMCLATIVWFASNSYLVALIAGFAIVGFGTVAGRMFRDEAWAFIPRRRQDRQRLLPLAWEIGSALVLAAVLALALLLLAFRLSRPDVSAGVREVTFGMGTAVALLVGADFVRGMVRSGWSHQRLLAALPMVMAVITSTVVAYGLLFDSSGPRSPATVLLGAVAMLAVGIAVALWHYFEERRAGDAAGPAAHR